MTELKAKLTEYLTIFDAELKQHLPSANLSPQRLHDAMHYVVFNGGKRVRPVLVFAAAEALGTNIKDSIAPAMSVELIHAYSLVHDDLPAMDDDDLRRGKPTCHIAYDEATAILVGDALLTLAFEILTTHAIPKVSAGDRLKMLKVLARASGSQGMVGGQAIDLEAVGKALTIEQLKQMHSLKTGALIRASVQLGAYASGAVDEGQLSALTTYATCLGLAFQIQDDILDIEGDTATLGKAQGSDEARNKPTYPALLGLDGAKQAAQEMHEQALDSLSQFDKKADTLRQLSAYVIARKM